MNNYSIFPKVSVLNEKAEFKIIPQQKSSLIKAGAAYSVSVTPVKNFNMRKNISVYAADECKLGFSFKPEIDGEYKVGIYPEGKKWPEEPFLLFSFYIVPESLKGFLPYKGDMHMHTFYSDGAESPAEMTIKAKGAGLDFIAITDHRVYDSSLEAAEYTEKTGLDILIIPGEEINYCIGLGHVLSLNAKRGICDDLKIDMFKNKETSERLGMMDDFFYLVNTGDDKQPSEKSLSEAAENQWYRYFKEIVKKIHDAGGFAVLNHPFWSSRNTMDLLRSTFELALSERLFDAYEVFGGMTCEENLLSMSRFNQEQMNGLYIPVIGTSDAHSFNDAECFGKRFSVVFAETLDIDNIFSAISSYRSVSCFISENSPILTGPFPLVEYTYFLFREFFPFHDELCRKISDLYFSNLKDGEENNSAASVYKDALKEFYRMSFNF